MKNFRLIAPDGRHSDAVFGDFLKIIREIFGGYVGFLYFYNAMEVSTTCPMGLGPGLTSIPSFFYVGTPSIKSSGFSFSIV